MRATIFFLTFVVFIGAVVWRVDHVMFGDKLAWGEAQARSQMSAMIQAVEAEVSALRDILILSYPEIEAGKKDYSASRPYGRLQMVAKVLPPSSKEDRREWRVVSTFFREKSATKAWASPYVSMALKSIQPNDVKMGSANMYSLLDPARKPHLLVLVHGNGNWYAGLVETQVFQGLMDQQKGQKSTAFIVNLQGQTLGHTIPEYAGSLLTEDPLVAELMKSSVSSGFGTFKDLKGTVIQGLYEQVERTNLYAVIATPIEQLTANRGQVRWQLILMGLGLGLIGLAYFLYTDRFEARASGSPGSPAPMATLPTSSSPASPPQTAVAAPAAINNIKMSAYTQVASSLSHELKNPLTSILGHAQLAMAQLEGAPKEHLQKIETEARAARDIIQKLLTFSGEDKVQSQKIGLETVVNRALKLVEGKIISKGIKLHKHIQSVPQFTMASDLLVKAVENVLLNSIEAMERAPRKELTLKLETEGARILLTIKDTGEGISESDLPKIFDPFFTTRVGTQHVGLGLSTAMGIFKEAFGKMKVESERGNGTSIVVEFTPQESLLSASTPLSQPVQVNFPHPAAKPKGPIPNEMVPPVAASVPAPPAVTISRPGLDELTLDPLLVDNTIERMIEDDLPEMPDLPNEVSASGKANEKGPLPDQAPSAPWESKAEADSSDVSKKDFPKPVARFSSKIDKPKIERKKKASRMDEIQVAVRRPGERS